jgi:molecular chaperone GrpE
MANAKRPTSAHAPSARPATRPPAHETEERALHAEARLAELDAALVATREEIERVSAERDAHKELVQRVAADFDNYRKRQVREREQQAVAANERLVLDLLPVLDALELAVDAFDNHEAEKVREGVAYVHRALLTALEKAGASTIDPHGAHFDPAEHEALMAMPDPTVDEGVVLQVHQRGFRLGDRVIRPARVVIAAAAPSPAPAPAEEA